MNDGTATYNPDMIKMQAASDIPAPILVDIQQRITSIENCLKEAVSLGRQTCGSLSKVSR